MLYTVRDGILWRSTWPELISSSRSAHKTAQSLLSTLPNGFRTSVAENLAPAETSAVANRSVPTIPLDVIEEILHRVARNPGSILTIRSCSLISKSWVTLSQRRLFYSVSFIKGDTVKWLQPFPMPEWSPAHHVRDLHFSLGGQYRVPDEFLGVAQWFTNLRKLTVSGKDVLLRAVGARRVIAKFQEPQPLAPDTVTATLAGPELHGTYTEHERFDVSRVLWHNGSK